MNYPEHEKLKALEGDNQTCGAFLEWLLDKYVLSTKHMHTDSCYDEDDLDCGMHEGYLSPEMARIENILAEYFEIDQKKLEEEKQKMLEELRNERP